MNKTELIKPVAEAAGISQTQAKAAIEKVFDTLVETLKNGENATLLGFGSFTVVERPERQGVNPKTGEKITLAAVSPLLPRYSFLGGTKGVWHNKNRIPCFLSFRQSGESRFF